MNRVTHDRLRNQDRKQEEETGRRPPPLLVCHDPDGAGVVGPVARAQLPIDVGAPGVELPLVGERQAVAVARHHLVGDKTHFAFTGARRPCVLAIWGIKLKLIQTRIQVVIFTNTYVELTCSSASVSMGWVCDAIIAEGYISSA